MPQARYLFHKQENVGRSSAASLSRSEKNLPNPAAPRHVKQTEKTGIIVTNAPNFNVTTHEWLSPPNPATFSDDVSVYLRGIWSIPLIVKLLQSFLSHETAAEIMTTSEMANIPPVIFLWCFEITALWCSSWTYFMRHSSCASLASEFQSWLMRLWKRLVTVCCVALPPMWLRAEPWLKTFLFRHVKV